MADQNEDSPRRAGVREGLKLVLLAGCLTPLIFLLEGLLPSRENTRIDELPQIALSVGLVGLTLAGVARMAYAFLAEGRRPRALAPSDRGALSDGRNARPLAVPDSPDMQAARVITPVHHTPI